MSVSKHLVDFIDNKPATSPGATGRGSTGSNASSGSPSGLGTHALDGPEHTPATGTDQLLATTDRAGLMPPLSGNPADAYLGDGTVGPIVATVPNIEEMATAETDPTLVFAPDGAGGVVARAETGSAGTGLPWFNVKDPAYGATGDGSTDDTSAISAAIAALNSDGGGVLYFPHGDFLCSSALTALAVPCIVLGDGAGAGPYASGLGSRVKQSSATAALFTFSDDGWVIRDLALVNSNGGTPSAGAAIVSGNAYFARLDRLVVSGFYDNIDLSDGAGWSIVDCFVHNPVRYGLRVRGTVSPDNGDQIVSGSYFMADTHNGTAAIRQESAGGLKIVGCKVNDRGTGGKFVDGVSVEIGSGNSTSILLLGSTSIENVSGDGVDISTTGTGSFYGLVMSGCQVGLFSNNTGRAVKITAASAGGLVNGGIGASVIDGCDFRTNGTARAAVELTNTDGVVLGEMALIGFSARYAGSGDTNTVDGAAEPVATAHIADPADAHDASAISIADAGGYFTGTDVEAALQELGPLIGASAGLIPVDTGTPTYDDGGDDVEVDLAVLWGIDGTDPYYDSGGVTPGDEAALYWDPATMTYVLVPFDF